MKPLIIVESPTKARTIKNYLPDYDILASNGHIRDLSTKGAFGYGVDVLNNFKPNYENIKTKSAIIKKLKDTAKGREVLLATDPDREGEAISWHLAELLELPKQKKNRIYFNEITKKAVTEAVESPRLIDVNLVNSQESRRIVDRIIGFDLSKLVQRKLYSTSAGRVQSVALKIIVDREKEIEAFVPEDYFLVFAQFGEVTFEHSKNTKRGIKTVKEANKILEELSPLFTVKDIVKKESKRYSPFPYTTSKLQQDGISRLKVSATSVMSIAQKLYEGVLIKDEMVGLITYMRTDSTRLSNEFVKETLSFIEKTYGQHYVGKVRRSQNKGAQDAHEAIRPTSIYRTPEMVKPYLDDKAYGLYKMIYDRSLAFLMKEGVDEVKTTTLENNHHEFLKTSSRVLFDGYRLRYNLDKEEDVSFEIGEQLTATKIYKEDKQTEPKRRYSEPTLIEELERLGIGRPSTYAETTRKITKINYVKKVKGYFHPTEQGVLTANSLDTYFNSFINTDYTKKMEEELDLIASGELKKEDMLTHFYKIFKPLVETANEKMPFQAIKKPVELLDELCPQCRKPLVYRENKKGERFIACTGFNSRPKCTYTRSF